MTAREKKTSNINKGTGYNPFLISGEGVEAEPPEGGLWRLPRHSFSSIGWSSSTEFYWKKVNKTIKLCFFGRRWDCLHSFPPYYM
jgi:hypothetical protein